MRLLSLLPRTIQRSVPCGCRWISSFRAEDLTIQKTDSPQPKPDMNTLKFGSNFSDHMLEIDWSEKNGWSIPQIKPLAPFTVHPAAKCFHYAIELFEGMKAYRGVDGQIRLFRPMHNMNRMVRSSQRAQLPTFDPAELLKCIKKLISLDAEWVPHTKDCTLYVRPTAIATEPAVGLSASNEAKIFVITCPVGVYYPTGLAPISLLADPQFVRAWPGGSGAFKMGSNYAPTISVQSHALNNENCQQVLWLFGEDHQMTEVGTMNLFIHWTNENGEEELITPSLESGLILPGITRQSLLDLTRKWDEFKVTEKDINMKTFVKALQENRVKEVFGSGTACVVSPVNKILYQGQALHIDGPSNLAQRLYDTLMDIQFYRTPHVWMETLDVDTADKSRQENRVFS